MTGCCAPSVSVKVPQLLLLFKFDLQTVGGSLIMAHFLIDTAWGGE
jgi:hypothetical protein